MYGELNADRNVGRLMSVRCCCHHRHRRRRDFNVVSKIELKMERKCGQKFTSSSIHSIQQPTQPTQNIPKQIPVVCYQLSLARLMTCNQYENYHLD